MHSRRNKWISGFGAVLLVGLLVTTAVAGDDGKDKNPLTQILNKLDQVLAAIGSGGGTVDLCYGGTTVGRFVVNGTEVCDWTSGLTWQKTPDAVKWPRLFGQKFRLHKYSPAVVCLRCLRQCRQVVEVDLIWCFVGKCRVRSSLVVERKVFV